MTIGGRIGRRATLLGSASATLAASLPAFAQQKPSVIKVGIATFLSGPASVFGVPGRMAAEMLIDEINEGGGIQGVKLQPIFVDEGPGVDHLVGEFRRL